MEKAQTNAEEVIRFLESRKEIAKVWFPGASILGEKQNAIFLNQMLGHGAMVSFVLNGGYKAAMQFLNALQTICLGVSLGSTESLAQHPFTMTHSNVDEAVRLQFGITPGLIRLSVGIEAPEDLIADLEQALVSIDNG
jgi:methionine-gamma-lyase